MFALCGTLHEANEVFNSLNPLTIFAWSALILAHVDHGSHHHAIELFYLMQRSSFCPNSYIFVAVLKACGAIPQLDIGMLIHAQVVTGDCESDVFVANTLTDMYAKCGLLEDARSVFDSIKEHSVASWTAIISAYSIHAHGEESLQLFHHMRKQGMLPNDVTFLCVLRACGSDAFLNEGKIIHDLVRRSSFAMDVMVGNAIISMYAKCGSLYYARKVFDELPKQNVVIWNAMISGYGQHGCGHEAFKISDIMQEHGVNPNKITFASVLKASSRIAAREEGRMTHSKIVMFGTEWDAFMESTLIDMYTECGCLKDAIGVFDNLPKRELFTWSAMISGLVHQKHFEEAFVLYHRMQQEGVKPNSIVFVCILKACSTLGLLDLGRCIHMFTTMSGSESVLEVGNTLIDMYTKAGSVEDALVVFEELQEKDTISWNAMIFGCAEHGFDEEALHLFSKLQCEGKQSTAITFLSALRACSDVTSLEWGRLINCTLVQAGCELDPILGSTLIDMYARCESLDDAVMVFNCLPNHNESTWSAIVVGCAQCADMDLALKYFAAMLQEGFNLNEVLFVSLLSACSHVGTVDEAFRYLNLMEDKYGIVPRLEHYCCVVDLLGRTGCINDAEALLKTIPREINHTVLSTLLGHCQTYCNVEVGNKCFDNSVFLDHRHASSYVLMSKLLKDANRWKDVEEVQALKANALAWKKPGNAKIKIGSCIFEFSVSDTSVSSDELAFLQRRLWMRLKDTAYMPHLDSTIHLLSSVEEGLTDESDSRHLTLSNF